MLINQTPELPDEEEAKHVAPSKGEELLMIQSRTAQNPHPASSPTHKLMEMHINWEELARVYKSEFSVCEKQVFWDLK